MRHKKRRRRLNRTASERKALMKSLVSALLTRQRITTTLAKAKEARRLAENVITLGKRGDLSSQRNLFSILLDRSLIKEIISEIAPRFKTRHGGYTRIIRSANRRKGDNAEMVLLELTEQKVVAPATKKAKKEKKEVPSAEKPQKPLKAEKPLKEELPKEAPAQKSEPPKPIKKEKHLPKKEKYPPKEEKRPPAEKSKKGFFQGLKRLFKPKDG